MTTLATHRPTDPVPDEPQTIQPWERLVREQIADLRFGVVQIVVHEGRVVHLERTQRVRFDSPSPSRRGGGAA